MRKKVLAALLASTMIIGSLSGCGSSSSQASSDSKTSTGNSEAIRFVNTKIEIDKPLKEFAKKYQEKTGQEVNIESLGGGVDVNGQLKNYLAAGNMPDIYAFGPDSYVSFKDYLTDLSDQEWVKDTDFAFKGDDGKVYGFPFAIEGIGLVYNADILKKAGIDPKTLTNINAYKEAFKKIDGMKEQLGIQAVASVAAESGQMYWSTGNHIMGAYLSEGLDRKDKKYIDMLNKGQLDDDRFGEFADYVKLLFDYADKTVLISGTYDDQLALWAKGKTAFITQGNWIDPSLATYDVKFDCGIAPPAFTTKDTPGILADAPAYWGIYKDSKKIDACKEFLKAFVSTEEGQKCLIKDSGMVSPFKTSTIEPDLPLAKSESNYIKNNQTYAWDWTHMKDGIAMNSTGPVFELYAKGQLDKDGFTKAMKKAVSDYMAK
ncbi:ABC transporter substrate-binding protein [Clostridium beijerinckii]|uniref:Maltose/maltodextrin-binding protein n=1 Tax=Clostridium beijerinckii TaxID=1520 RepID=A0A1S8S3V7_CLOBE|nr:extracellular solute-binding protein [Clostridium beijerinckii]MBA8937038.1 raffinose/stachyose/melibiose transport system substrate-binding protein [Clostridium beijerinckii]NRU40496.1 raffinose/stachyose/melibiose transport system substrate-binding protein [Clostridium beijerinckii]NRY62410.1 raffinose/stachyose/melibiose transport system substrate-binding protein [Clostridium beijerinckii]NSA96228.1 raffinose/stachyose/melibiose transport system substrate-binding protein [Clostridium beij